MKVVPQADHPKAQFSNNLLEAIDFRHKCPICTASLFKDSNLSAIRNDPDYCLIIRNMSNTSDQLKIKKDGVTAELVSTDTLIGRHGLFNFPLRMTCGHCNSYSHNFKIIMSMMEEENNIKDIILVSMSLRLSRDENLVIKTLYEQNKTVLYINDKPYEIEFMDFNPTKYRELYERFSVMVPFV